jgi:hypothetical protein
MSNDSAKIDPDLLTKSQSAVATSHTVPVAQAAKSEPDWEQLYGQLRAENEKLSKELGKALKERDQYRRSLLHYVQREFGAFTMTKEEVLADCGKNKQTIEELIDELERSCQGKP